MIIPQANENRDNYPCWKAVVDLEGNPKKPTIYCKCGKPCGIEGHSINEKGEITPSFWHYKFEPHEVSNYDEKTNGCGFHEYLQLEGYNGQSLPSKKGQ